MKNFENKTFGLFYLLTICLFGGCTKEPISPESTAFTMDAAYGTRYQIRVQVPESYDPARPDPYPALLFLDADWLENPVRKAIAKNNLTEKVILVGISYDQENRRMQDYSPTATSEAGTGNAANFLNFLDTVVLKQVRQQYHVSERATDYTFCGHSMGGLFGIYALLQRPDLFANYILISSALMFDEQAIFKIETQNRHKASGINAKVFSATGTLEERGMHVTRQHLAKLFQSYYPGIQYKHQNYSDKDHSGVVAPGLQDGIAFVYNF